MQNDVNFAAMQAKPTVPAGEAEAIRTLNKMYEDGIIDQLEADKLFDLQTHLSDENTAWQARFSEAVRDYVLSCAMPSNWVTNDEARWLIIRIDQTERAHSWMMIDLLIDILRKADGAPDLLSDYLLAKLTERCLEDGKVGAEEVERLRFALFAGSGSGSAWVNETEADCLFAINDATAQADNHPNWNDFFARAIANYIMAKSHPDPITEYEALSRDRWIADTKVSLLGVVSKTVGGLRRNYWGNVRYDQKGERKARMERAENALNRSERVTQIESAWVHSKIKEDAFVSPAERALIDFLKQEAPDFVAQNV